MKQMNLVLGIVTISIFLFYLTFEVSPIETDLENLSSFGFVEYLDGNLFLTILDTLSEEEIKTLQRLETYFDVHLIESEGNDVLENPQFKSRGPP